MHTPPVSRVPVLIDVSGDREVLGDSCDSKLLELVKISFYDRSHLVAGLCRHIFAVCTVVDRTDSEVVAAETGSANVLELNVSSRKLFSLIPPLDEELIVLLERVVAVYCLGRSPKIVASLVLRGELENEVDEVTNVHPALAVVSLQELVHVGVVLSLGHVGILEGLRHEVATESLELTALVVALVVRLGDDTDRTYISKSLNVREDVVEIRPRAEEVLEVDRVVPDVELVTDLGPCVDLLLARGVYLAVRVVVRVVYAVRDRAELDRNVVVALDILRAREGVRIRERDDRDVSPAALKSSSRRLQSLMMDPAGEP